MYNLKLILWAMLLIALLKLTGNVLSHVPTMQEERKTQELANYHVVEYHITYGDTLWDIYNYHKIDIPYERWKWYNEQMNNKNLAYIYAGETIKVYVKGE